MSLETGFNATLARLHTLGIAQKFDVFESALPNGYKSKYQNKVPLPYVMVDFGGEGQQVNSRQGITGTRDNMHWTSIVFEIVAPAPDTCRQIAAFVRDTFTGWQAQDTWSELIEVFNGQFVINMPDGTDFWPVRYTRTVIYTCDTNA